LLLAKLCPANSCRQAIVGAIGSAGILGTVILIILALTMGYVQTQGYTVLLPDPDRPDVATVYNSVQPMAYIFLEAFGTRGSIAVWSFM
jgi:hypothetical protein